MVMDSGNTKRSGLIGNPRDFIGGLGFLLLALFVLWATRHLPGQRGFQLGAGSVPRLFALLLAANAVFVMAISVFGRGPAVQYAIGPSLALAALIGVGVLTNHFAGAELAAAVLIFAAFASMHKLTALNIRGPVFIAIAILAFAVFIKPLGLFITVFALVAVSSAASKEYKPVESMIWAFALAVFSVCLFVLLLSQPISAFPPSLLTR
jgi:putative tricarboxylic transport membrane protein